MEQIASGKNSLERYNNKTSPILSKKIKTCVSDELLLIIRYICTAMEISVVPGTYETKVISEWILNKYPQYGIMEFKTAFDMYANHELPKKDDEKHYVISTSLIGNVMNKYRIHRIKLKKALTDTDPERPKPTYDESVYESSYNSAVRYIEKHKKLPLTGHWPHIYDHFKAKGMGWYALGDKERRAAMNEFWEIVRNQLSREAVLKDHKAENAKLALRSKKLLQFECRRRYAKQELRKLIKLKTK